MKGMHRTRRERRPDDILVVKPDLLQVAFSPTCCFYGLDDTQLLIRRAGCDDDDWLLAYNPFTHDDEGRTVFRFDAELHKLDPGFYDAVLMVDCVECGLLRLDKTKKRPLSLRDRLETAYQECPPPGEQLPDSEADNMYDAYHGWTTKLSCATSRDETVLKVDQILPVPLPEVPPQLVIRDGAYQETVTVTAGGSGTVTVARGSPARDFPKGACIQFEWTTDNVRAVANENCESDGGTDQPGSGTDGGDDTASSDCTVLAAGKGLSIEPRDDGTFVISLAPTNVVAGEYGGLNVDECGRVTSVDAQFPANAIPVFDGCCADDEAE